jgi:DNA-binding response OmpR family regulator
MRSKIILLESNSDLNSRLKTNLEQKGFEVIHVSFNSVEIAEELVLHMNRLFNPKDSGTKNYSIGNVVFVPEEHLLKHKGKEISLCNNENILLKLLCDNRNRVVSKRKLTAEIWNETDPKMKEHCLNNLIYSIREKLTVDTDVILKTIPKEGYKLS